MRTICPEVGELRRSLDEPSADVAGHVADCADCREQLSQLRANAELAGAAIASLAPAGARSAAFPGAPGPWSSRLTSPSPAGAGRGAGRRERGQGGEGAAPARPLPIGPARWRVALGGLAAAAAVAIVATVPAAQTAAAGFLAQFRSQRFVAVQVDRAQGRGVFSHFRDLGVIQEPNRPRPQRVATLAEASGRVGFTLKEPDPSTLPRGIAGPPVVEVSPAHELRFTLQKPRVEEYLRRVGRPDVAVPDKLDGATLVVGVPAGALLQYRAPNGDRALMIGQANEITAGVEGNATLDELRDYLLSLPGLPPEAVAQLRAVQDWRTTLPIPVPAQNVDWQNTTVDGAPALMVADATGLGAGVIWQRDGRIHGVAGTFGAEEVLRVANGLR